MWFGIYTVLFSFLGIAYALILRIFTTNFVQGWTLLFIAMLFLGGVQMISLGIIGEYLARVYRQVKDRPLYLVNDRIGFHNSARTNVTSRDGVGCAREEVEPCLLGVVIGAVFLYLTLRRIEWDEVEIVLADARWQFIPLALLFLSAGYILRIIRWWYVLRLAGIDVTPRVCAARFFIGFALNNVLPSVRETSSDAWDSLSDYEPRSHN